MKSFANILSSISLNVQLAHFLDVILSQFCHSALLALCRIPPAFSEHIIHVILLSSGKEVTGTNTGRVIAMMKDFYFFREVSIFKLERDSVGKMRRSLNGEFPISVWETPPCPHPAFFGAINLTPKSFHDSLRSELARRVAISRAESGRMIGFTAWIC